MPSLAKHDAIATLRGRLRLFGIEDSMLEPELSRGKFTARQLNAIIDALDMVHRTRQRASLFEAAGKRGDS